MNEYDRLRKFNMVIVPRVGRAFYNIAVSYHLIYVAAAVIVLAIGVNIYLFAGYQGLKGKMVKVHKLQQENAQVKKLIKDTEEIESDLKKIKDTNKRIEQKTGISVEPGYVEYTAHSGGDGLPSSYTHEDIGKLNARLEELRREVEARKRSVLAAEYRVNVLSRKYAGVPSISPVPGGKLNSPFGYRTHPISGSYEFHEGIDIGARTGTPVHATAEGKVVFSGWRYGYGLAVGIQHASGFSTLYAHNSANLVRQGDIVSKNQVIAYAGSTGSTTGEHVHYEVRFQNRLLNPVRFLNLTFKDMEQMF